MQSPTVAAVERIRGETQATGDTVGAGLAHTHERDRDVNNRLRNREAAAAGGAMEPMSSRQEYAESSAIAAQFTEAPSVARMDSFQIPASNGTFVARPGNGDLGNHTYS